MVDLVCSLVAGAAQQVEELADLRVQVQARVDRTEEVGLSGLDQRDPCAGGHRAGQRLGQQAQLEHTAGRIERKDAFSGGAEVGQQRRVFSQKAEIAALFDHRASRGCLSLLGEC